MEALADPHRCLVEVKSSIQNGLGLRSALREFFKKDNSRYAKQLAHWLAAQEQGQQHEDLVLRKNAHRMALLSLFQAGLAGESIYERLLELEIEMDQAARIEIEEKLKALPMKVLLPLLFLQFPAFLLLLFGPILQQLRDSLS